MRGLQRYLKRKERIVLSAINIIDDLGINGFTIRELADKENITEGAIYKHFANKKDILIAIIDKFSMFDKSMMSTVKEKCNTGLDGLVYFLDSLLGYYENYPMIVSILSNNYMFEQEPEAYTKIKNINSVRYKFLCELVAKGQLEGEIRNDIESTELVNIIFGYVIETIYNWKNDNRNFSLKDRILTTLKKLIA